MFEYTNCRSVPLRQASMFCLTAAALSGSPFWNVMPERRPIVHSV